ncbi:MAG TPA: threonine synthase [Anaerohalosphaeraceae bacterium]|nr:threonine synthase [Phycisphaerae bacterium]HOK95241.1 threonine synthase [Anaerohalosphaeraceae bacterium]HOL30699.1 threonine synthase [Anaerohalosphaeraceae bacterium]HOM75131.1 threonine synthase [Anaerohalosphaeraceae bacterium]HPC63440.1 threonine synthase [Anaerohalosphaeraceae bacterium]
MKNKDRAYQKCINLQCSAEFDCSQVLFKCPRCGDLLDVKYDWNRISLPARLRDFSKRWASRQNRLDFSGVWRFRELLDFCDDPYKVTVGEGQTLLQQNDALAGQLGMGSGTLFLQYEGLNPSGSFKDNGMAAAFSHAKMVGAVASACASTGNTSASMALYAHSSGLKATVFIGEGKIAFGKLSQSMDYGAHTIQVAGDFDDCMRQVQDVCAQLHIYLVNSLNPFRLEGQKTIMLRIIEGLNWEVPDWIIVPGGNLGNSSAFGKAFAELKEVGLIDRIPRLAVINARGANTLAELVNDKGLRWNGGHVNQAIADAYFAGLDAAGYRPNTIASAIEISRPVNLKKCLRALEVCNGVVLDVTDEEILDAKAQVGKFGLGCEPASAATIAGLKYLLADGTVDKNARVACVLTGHLLKDPNATVNYHSKMARIFSNPPVQVKNDLDEIIALMK